MAADQIGHTLRNAGRLLLADRCPPGKHCSCGHGIGVVSVGKLAHLTGELLVSVFAHVVVVQQVSNRARQMPTAAPTPIGDAGDVHLSVGHKRRNRDLAQSLAQPRLRANSPCDRLLLQGPAAPRRFGSFGLDRVSDRDAVLCVFLTGRNACGIGDTSSLRRTHCLCIGAERHLVLRVLLSGLRRALIDDSQRLCSDGDSG
ncbi:hypothetical protein GGP55_003121 [Salinibacter ruber]|nr:hypothetical protein [Salinibacter ruber]